jgi:CheY-like chemotaxis protein
VARRILGVEDNADAAELLAEALADAGHQVEVAHDGPAALAAAGRLRPEIALVDIGLPGMDGYEVARRLRAADPPPAVVALTGYGQEEDRRRTEAAGMRAHLTKPFDVEALQRVIRRLTDGP